MISIVALWLPIVLSAVLVFFVSALIYMVLPYHRKDFRKLPEEDRVLGALAPLDIPPGDYVMPHAPGMEAMRSEEHRAKVERGPVAFMTVMNPAETFNMGPQLVQWFAYSLLVGALVAYVAGRTLTAGADYLSVFRLAGTVAFACYAMSLPQRSIWYKQAWPTTLRMMFDGVVYASLTAGVFGWLWPTP